MSAGATTGGTVGGIAGGAIGGVIGSFIPPPGLGTFLGRAIGSRVGRLAGRAAGALLDDYVSSMEEADAEADADADSEDKNETCLTCCEESAGDVKDALYNNKRNPNNPNQGNHGYMNRMVEQMCGAQGPGTRGWDNHVDQLRGAQRRLDEAYEPFQGEDGVAPECDPSEFFSSEEREAINNILRGQEGWTPDTIPHLGPNHPRCAPLPSAVSNGRMRDYLNIIRPRQGQPTGPFTS